MSLFTSHLFNLVEQLDAIKLRILIGSINYKLIFLPINEVERINKAKVCTCFWRRKIMSCDYASTTLYSQQKYFIMSKSNDRNRENVNFVYKETSGRLKC